LNRKNALFAGSDGGAEHWAVIASLIETCKLNGIDPQFYLADVITKIVNGHPNRRIDDLLPWTYPAAPTLRHVACADPRCSTSRASRVATSSRRLPPWSARTRPASAKLEIPIAEFFESPKGRRITARPAI
jgi:hypothetical protein